MPVLGHAQRKAPEHQVEARVLSPDVLLVAPLCLFLQTLDPKPCPMAKDPSCAPPPKLYWTFGHQSMATLCLGPLPDKGPHLL